MDPKHSTWQSQISFMLGTILSLLVFIIGGRTNASTIKLAQECLDKNYTDPHKENSTAVIETQPVNPYLFDFIIQAAPCDAQTELLVVVHSATKVRK